VSAYIPVGLQRRVRDRFQNCCAYCHTAEALMAMTFEFEHITGMATIRAIRYHEGTKTFA
jgi:hypothetical protein